MLDTWILYRTKIICTIEVGCNLIIYKFTANLYSSNSYNPKAYILN